MIGAAIVVSGQVFEIDGTLMLTLKIFETDQATMLATRRIDADSQRALIDKTRTASHQLIRKALGLREAGSKTRVHVRGVQLELSYAPGGTFEMGSPTHEPERMPDETIHSVTLSRGFYIGTTEVTQELYTAVMGENLLSARRPILFRHPPCFGFKADLIWASNLPILWLPLRVQIKRCTCAFLLLRYSVSPCSCSPATMDLNVERELMM